MGEKRLWLETDYYENFRCKGGACRSSCCEGWQIALGMKEYFNLIGMECSDEMHHRLECAFRVPENPSPEHFRVISPNWQGRCPLHGEDGLCMLQVECGEAALPEICRIYPRSLKNESGVNQACCSASCEAVVELLLQEEKLNFRLAEMDAEPEISENMDTDLLEIGSKCMKILQQREINISQRILNICRLVRSEKDVVSIGKADAFRQALHILNTLAEDFDSIHCCGETALKRYGGEDGFDIYLSDAAGFESAFPRWKVWYENLLANHLLYMDIPCVDKRISESDACDGLCLLYALMRIIPAAWCALHPGEESFVDVIAGIFRLAEHSSFYYNAHVLMKNGEALLVL